MGSARASRPWRNGFLSLGALVIDADVLAREVVAVGSPGLAAIHERFGDAVLAADGSLDRGALGEIVFADPQARKDLEAITHPLIGARTRSLLESAAPERIVVHDVPLLVELDMTADYHLTVVVGADEDVRVARLTGGRGFTEADARARVSRPRPPIGSVVRLPTRMAGQQTRTVDRLLAQVDALAGPDRGLQRQPDDRLSQPSPGAPTLVPYDDSWPFGGRPPHRADHAR